MYQKQVYSNLEALRVFGLPLYIALPWRRMQKISAPCINLGMANGGPGQAIPGAEAHFTEVGMHMVAPAPLFELLANQRATPQRRGMDHARPLTLACSPAKKSLFTGRKTWKRTIWSTSIATSFRPTAAPGRHRSRVRTSH